MGLGFVGAGGVAGGQAALDDVLQKRLESQLLAQKLQQQEFENALANRKFAEDTRQFDAGLGLQRDKFGFDQQQWSDEAPTRDANAAHIRTQTQEVLRKPMAEAADRAHDLETLGIRGKQATELATHEGRIRSGHIAQQGAIDTAGALAAAKAKAAAEAPSPYTAERSQRTRQSVRELMGKVGVNTSGWGSLLSYLPATDARNFAAELDTLKANIAFNELAQMRAASKTGGALGSVSERELALLEATLGALDAGQSPENLRQQLQKVDDSIARWEQAQAAQQVPQAGIQAAPMAAPDNDPLGLFK